MSVALATDDRSASPKAELFGGFRVVGPIVHKSIDPGGFWSYGSR